MQMTFPDMQRNHWREICGKHGVNEAQVGKSRVLYRANDHHILELLRVLALDRIVPLCQRIARGAIHRRFFRGFVHALQIYRMLLTLAETARQKLTC